MASRTLAESALSTEQANQLAVVTAYVHLNHDAINPWPLKTLDPTTYALNLGRLAQPVFLK